MLPVTVLKYITAFRSHFPRRKDFMQKKTHTPPSLILYLLRHMFQQWHTKSELSKYHGINVYMYSVIFHNAAHKKPTPTNQRKKKNESQTNGNIRVGMKFSHNNATHLDISKYIYTTNNIYCACAKVIFFETIRCLFVSHSCAVVCTCGMLHWSVNYNGKCEYQMPFFRIFYARIVIHRDGEKNIWMI